MSLGEKISGVPFSEGWSYDQFLVDENKQKWYMPFDICAYSFLEGGLSAGVRSPSSEHKVTTMGKKVSFCPEGKTHYYVSK